MKQLGMVGSIVAALAGTALAAPSADEVAAKVRAYYAHVSHLQARYHIVNIIDGKPSTMTTDGHVWLARPAKQRWDRFAIGTDRVDLSQISSDGKKIWTFDLGGHTAYAAPADRGQSPSESAFFFAAAKLGKAYDVELDTSGTYGTKDQLVLHVHPHGKDGMLEMFLVVDPSDDHVVGNVVVDGGGDKHVYSLTDLDIKTAPPRDTFRIDLRGYRVVE